MAIKIHLFLSGTSDDGELVKSDDNPIIMPVLVAPEVGELIVLGGVRLSGEGAYVLRDIGFQVTRVVHHLEAGYSILIHALAIEPEDFKMWLPRSEQWW